MDDMEPLNPEDFKVKGSAFKAPPAEDEVPPAEGEAPPAEGEVPPAEGGAPPAEGEAPGEDTIDPIGDDAVNDLGKGGGKDEAASDLGLGDEDNAATTSGDNEMDQISDSMGFDEFPEPEKVVKWNPITSGNNEIVSKHVDGFMLRARQLSVKNGEKTKYAVQLFKGNKMVDKGSIWLSSNADPRATLQNIADRILNKLGLTSHYDDSGSDINDISDAM